MRRWPAFLLLACVGVVLVLMACAEDGDPDPAQPREMPTRPEGPGKSWEPGELERLLLTEFGVTRERLLQHTIELSGKSRAELEAICRTDDDYALLAGHAEGLHADLVNARKALEGIIVQVIEQKIGAGRYEAMIPAGKTGDLYEERRKRTSAPILADVVARVVYRKGDQYLVFVRPVDDPRIPVAQEVLATETLRLRRETLSFLEAMQDG